ncbi:terminal nucleotidyltransferase 4A-like [Haliaeetus albicilla]|uniref:terminal nucleotidyltransferase 4A-like n=1 Tax=Haliaeetus albicilla TaxID=8969 RepID=UPI0037E8A4FB
MSVRGCERGPGPRRGAIGPKFPHVMAGGGGGGREPALPAAAPPRHGPGPAAEGERRRLNGAVPGCSGAEVSPTERRSLGQQSGCRRAATPSRRCGALRRLRSASSRW